MDDKKYTILNNNIRMPMLGLGTYMNEDYTELKNCIDSAIDIGYRHIDTASYYNNESQIGKILNENPIKREELFLTTKLWNDDHGYDKTLTAFNSSLKRLKTDYVDLYLIHWPNPAHKETWRAMEKLYKDGYVKAIGVCNYNTEYLNELIENSEVMPSVNQIEFHPHLIQNKLMNFCSTHNIQIEAWAPLMRGGIFNIELLKDLACKYNKSISQIILRWDIQNGVVTIPKSSKIKRIRENSDIFNFNISEEDMRKINNLNIKKRLSKSPEEVYMNPHIFD